VTDPNPLHHPRYHRSNGYDPAWITRNQMGPNVLWLTESLTEIMRIEPGMKVLDLGCGRAMSSIFLAREFGARVWATDLWISAADNQERVVEAGLTDLVTPIHAEAHALPYAAGFFDAIVSLDAYQYFGTDDLYLGYLLDFLAPEHQIGIVVPATTRELGAEIPPSLERFWEWEFGSWHSPTWWRTHWAKTGKVAVEHADLMDDAWRDWLRFNDFIAPHVEGWWVEDVATTHDMLTTDQGKELGWARVLATKLARPTREGIDRR
jgi:cyclopropane fatty-acyl-phospholipid synthase-like methyltransferase